MRASAHITAIAVALIAAGARVGADDSYNSFMNSLSSNWQNEFSDLRYQVDQLQKTDPQKYQALALSLGLKPGMQVSVPSLFDAQWASMFVNAAGLYTPPAPTLPAATYNPANALPTASVFIPTVSVNVATATSGSQSHDVSASNDMESDGSSGAHQKTSKSKSHTAGDDGLDDVDQDTSIQYGNPIVGDIGDNTPIKPSGHGYSGAAMILAAASTYFALPIAMWALL
ncbi:hypothetical protein GQ54DRAFT_311837 [Martensiomyces pterosporus]|nr:hypothetical protein GQ54DRAFT_311837 [Martensiomyces pterosporus]